MGRFILGFILAFVGFTFVWKTQWFIQNFGTIEWAERHLGTEGGSRTAYKVLGTIVIFGGLMYAFNLSDDFFSWIADLIV